MEVRALDQNVLRASPTQQSKAASVEENPELGRFQSELNTLQKKLNQAGKDQDISSEEKQEVRRQLQQQIVEVQRQLREAKREARRQQELEEKEQERQDARKTDVASSQSAARAQSDGQTTGTSSASGSAEGTDTAAATPAEKYQKQQMEQLYQIGNQKQEDPALEKMIASKRMKVVVNASDTVHLASNQQTVANGLGSQVRVIHGEIVVDKQRGVDTRGKEGAEKVLTKRMYQTQQSAQSRLHDIQVRTQKELAVLDKPNPRKEELARNNFNRSYQSKQQAISFDRVKFHTDM